MPLVYNSGSVGKDPYTYTFLVNGPGLGNVHGDVSLQLPLC